MSEATGRDAQTLHRLLEFEPARATFKRDARNPVDADVLVVDEASMVDLPMADALLAAVGAGTRLVLVGDVDQLPSVGPGAVLRDVIASGVVPTVRLVHVFRQAKQSLIVENAHRINAGELPESAATDAAGADFFVVERKDPEQARATVVELVSRRIPQRFGLDPLRDVQVLVPMHRGEAGAAALNAALQQALNPSGRPAGRNLRVGDKVMQLKNDYDKDVWNGDLGVVARADEDGPVVVRFEDGRSVEYAPEDTEDLTLAYACTIHKSQGSEYPAVVVVLLTSHFVMLSRNLLYTAVTRGKRLVVLVAHKRALEVAVREDRRGERRSSLARRLRESEIDPER
jgi:exodeoxyribonuclease V alpha subunit